MGMILREVLWLFRRGARQPGAKLTWAIIAGEGNLGVRCGMNTAMSTIPAVVATAGLLRTNGERRRRSTAKGGDDGWISEDEAWAGRLARM